MTVPVRYEADDLVLIGSPPAGPAGIGIVGLPAGEVHIDPAAPDDAPFAVIHDAGEAADAIHEIFGPEVAAAALRTDAEPGVTVVRPGRAARAVRAVGLLGWLQNWSPDALPSAILDIEYGSAVAELDDLLADHVLDDGTDRLVRQASVVTELSRLLRDADQPVPPPGLAELMAVAVPMARAVTPLDHPGYGELEHEDELALALSSVGVAEARVDWSSIAELAGVGERELVGAATLGDAVEVVTAQVSSVDWFQVPRGLLDTAEDTISWSVTDGGAGDLMVTVSVRAHAGAPSSDRLAFRLYAEGHPLPVACGALRRTLDGAEFAGRAPVFASGPSSRGRALVLDVYDEQDPRPPRLGTSRTSARATRWAARAVTGLRLGDRGPSVARVARGGLEEAARLFATVAANSPDPRQQTTARRRQARCVALVRAILVADGQQRAADQMGRRWARPPDGVLAGDVGVPDLAGPGWTPLVTERMLLARPPWRAG